MALAGQFLSIRRNDPVTAESLVENDDLVRSLNDFERHRHPHNTWNTGLEAMNCGIVNVFHRGGLFGSPRLHR